MCRGTTPAPLQQVARVPRTVSRLQRGRRSAGRGHRCPQRGTHVNTSINDFSHEQLVALARWIESDTLLRTESDLIAELMDELGFRRGGKRIIAALEAAVRTARR